MKTVLSRLSVLIIAFLFFNCSSDSGDTPCFPITCLNGGTSTPECGCNCPQGYTGSNCSTQITPNKITITKIEIVSFPTIDPSAITGNWDYFPISSSQNAPDLAIVLYDFTTSTILSNSSSNPFTDAQNTQSHSYTYPSFLISNVNNLFSIQLRDIDTNSSFQIMDTYVFSIYDNEGGFPSIIPIINGDTKYNLYVTYNW